MRYYEKIANPFTRKNFFFIQQFDIKVFLQYGAHANTLISSSELMTGTVPQNKQKNTDIRILLLYETANA